MSDYRRHFPNHHFKTPVGSTKNCWNPPCVDWIGIAQARDKFCSEHVFFPFESLVAHPHQMCIYTYMYKHIIYIINHTHVYIYIYIHYIHRYISYYHYFHVIFTNVGAFWPNVPTSAARSCAQVVWRLHGDLSAERCAAAPQRPVHAAAAWIKRWPWAINGHGCGHWINILCV